MEANDCGDAKRRKRDVPSKAAAMANGTSLLDLPDHVIVESILPLLFPSSLSDDEPPVRDLRDILSFASTCTRIHALASHPSLWRSVNAAMFHSSFLDAINRGVAHPQLPLGAVHCGVFSVGHGCADDATITIVESLSSLTEVSVNLEDSFIDCISAARVIASLPLLVHLEGVGQGTLRAVADAKVLTSSRSLEYLGVSCDSGDMVRLLSTISLPSLTEIDVYVESNGAQPSELIAAIAKSCPALTEAHLCSFFEDDFVSLVRECRSLQKLHVSSYSDPTSAGACCPNLLELVVSGGCAFASGFHSVFPNLVRLELLGIVYEITDTELTEIGGLMNLKHLSLYGGQIRDAACRRLLPLANHPLTSGRRSLESLSLWSFDSDLVEFLSSPWCSHLVSLTLGNSWGSNDVWRAIGATLPQTLQQLRVMDGQGDLSATLLGRCVALLPQLRELVVESHATLFNCKRFARESSDSGMKLSRFTLSLPKARAAVSIEPMLANLRDATDVSITGHIKQATIDAIAASCPHLRRLRARSVFRKQELTLDRPALLPVNCIFG